MIIYESTKGEFMDAMDEDTLVDTLEVNYIERVGRRTTKSEKTHGLIHYSICIKY